MENYITKQVQLPSDGITITELVSARLTPVAHEKLSQQDFLALFPGSIYQFLIDNGSGPRPVFRTYQPEKAAPNHGHFFTPNGMGDTPNPTGEHTLRHQGNVVSLNAVWVDIDGLTDKTTEAGRCGEKDPRHLHDFLEKCADLNILPTIINESKNGYHVFWLLEKPTIATPESIAKQNRILKNLVAVFGGDPSCAESSRVLRIPGSVHIKDPEKPFIIKTISYALSNRYTLEELEKLVPERPTAHHKVVRNENHDTIPADIIARAYQIYPLEERPSIKFLLSSPELAEGLRHASILYLTTKLRAVGWTLDEVLAHFQKVGSFGLEKLRDRADEYRSVCADVYTNDRPYDFGYNSEVWENMAARPELARDLEQEKQDAKTAIQTAYKECDKNEEIQGLKNIEFLMSGGKIPKPALVLENICRVLEHDEFFSGILRLNDFSGMTEVFDMQTKNWVLLSDGFIFDAIRHISITYSCFVELRKDMITNAILSMASHNKINPPKDYVLSLQWDGTPRLDSWLHFAYGTPDDQVHREIGANWLKGLVSRIIRPGCQFDHILVLEAPQGWRKSSSLRVLGEPWHVECTMSPDSKDFFMILAQNSIVEFSEGDIVNRTDVKKLKGVVTKVQDQVRLPYERGVSTLKRGCVFAMTTNDSDYLKDETGNRRWLPIRLGKVADVEWIRANRDQLYAEAYHRVIELNETTYEYSDEELLKDMQESRRERNDYEEDIIMWYLGLSKERRENGIRLKEVYNEVICPPSDNSNFTKEVQKISQLQISGMLRGALHLESKSVNRNKKVWRRWLPTEETIKKFNLDEQGEKRNSTLDLSKFYDI